MLGIGGTRSNLSRKTLRGGGGTGRIGAGRSPQEQKRELLRRLQSERQNG